MKPTCSAPSVDLSRVRALHDAERAVLCIGTVFEPAAAVLHRTTLHERRQPSESKTRQGDGMRRTTIKLRWMPAAAVRFDETFAETSTNIAQADACVRIAAPTSGAKASHPAKNGG